MSADRKWIVVSALLLALAALLGAFGAHALQARVAPDRLAAWRTAVDFHFYHAFGLFGLALLMQRWPDATALRWAAVALLCGVLLFSGSIYLTVLGAPRWIGMAAPIGGIAFMLAWLLTAIAAWRRRPAAA
jgi:uncharacterized membrane protein YgdD (TMEM256/DUF423 family)